MSDSSISPFRAKLLKESEENFSYELGNAAFVQGKLDEAIVLYNRALEVNSQNAKVLGNLSKVLSLLGEETRAADARRRADAAAPMWPADADYDLGRAWEVIGRADEAEAAYLRAYEFDRNHLGAVLCAMAIFFSRMDLRNALDAYSRAIGIDPDAPSIVQRNTAASALFYSDRFEEALQACEAVIAVDRRNLRAGIMKSMVLHALERYDDAVEAARQTLDGNPDNVWVLLHLTKCLTSLRRFADARTTLEQAAARQADRYWQHMRLGQILVGEGIHDQALEAFRQAAAMVDAGAQPDEACASWLNVAHALALSGDAGAALSLIEGMSANGQTPANGWPAIMRGAILDARGSAENAAAAFREGLAMQTAFAWADVHLCDPSAARQWLERARSSTPA